VNSNFPVHLFEEHSSTLPIWWQHRSKPRTAVYLDAHLDLQQTSREALHALQTCTSLQQVKALEAPHHLNPASRYAFGIENFLYPASKLNLIDRLIWVVPPHIPRQYSSALLDYIQQMNGISFAELSGFKTVGEGALRGTLLGLDITLCDFQQLHSLNISRSYYLDIDVDYFVQVPEDRLWIDPGEVIPSILNQLGDPAVATISRAVSSGFTPLSMHFLADYVAQLLQGTPADADAAPYRYLVTALEFIYDSQATQAIEICQQAIRTQPGVAATHFICSIAMELAGRTAIEISTERARAIELEPAYAFDVSRAACGIPNRHRNIGRKPLDALATQLQQIEPDKAGLAEVAIAHLYAQSGELKQAWQLLQKQQGELQNHAELLLAIARGILESDSPQHAQPLLERAAKSSKTRTSATLFLGDLAVHQGQIKQALEHYQRAHALAPAWLLPLQRQLHCLDKLTDAVQGDKIRAIITHREQVLANLSENTQSKSKRQLF